MANGLALKGSMEKLAPGGGLSLSLCVKASLDLCLQLLLIDVMNSNKLSTMTNVKPTSNIWKKTGNNICIFALSPDLAILPIARSSAGRYPPLKFHSFNPRKSQCD